MSTSLKECNEELLRWTRKLVMGGGKDRVSDGIISARI
jgi:hypothetical protein